MRTHRTLLAGAACLVLLTGCGAQSPDAAATVGDDTISMAKVDETTTNYCAATEKAYEANGVVLPMATVRRQVMSSLVLREVADQMAETYDVGPDTTYDQAVASSREQTRGMSEARREAAMEVDTVGAYLRDIAVNAARADLKSEGATGLSDEQVLEKAIDLFSNWTDTSPVELNPKFGTTYEDGQFVSTDDGQLSVGVSQAAKDASIVTRFENASDQQEQVELAQQLTGYARTLPEPQRCG